MSNDQQNLEQLINQVIEAAPLCLKNKLLLQAMDWRKVAAEKVEAMLATLDEARRKPPPWLLTDLLVAGHHVDPARLERLSLGHKLLNRLNDPDSRADADSLRQTARDVAARKLDHVDLAGALIRQFKTHGLAGEALQLALNNWQTSPQLMRPVMEDLKTNSADLPVVKLRLLGYSTTNPLAGDLPLAFAGAGFTAEVVEANFGEVIPELLKPIGENPDAYLLLLDREGFHPHDWRQSPEDHFNMLAERLDLLASALTGFVAEKNIPVYVNTLPLASSPTHGFIDRHHASGGNANIRLVNQRLAELAAANGQITLIDSIGAMADIAPHNWIDPKMWYYGRIPYSAEATRALAGGFARAWRAEKKGPAKVLAIDLDNTMWGGIFGEDGMTGIESGDDFPGNAFKAMQGEFLRLKNQGMILTLLSKNNPDAITAFAEHPGILLNEDDFVAHRINWLPKPDNIRELAKELNLGLDSFVFLDDSPHEREAMRALAPEVHTPELPDDPAQRPGWLRSLSNTWPIRLTDEDAKRSSMYLADKKAKDLKSSAASFEDYLKGLEQKLIVEDVSETTLPRIAQMHTRTNQFNLTTLRLEESEIHQMMEDDQHKVILGRAGDKFGDHGIVICATVATNGDSAEIKTLLMSCRVIGREVETAFLGALIEELAGAGIKTIKASYIPTVKNVIVAQFYEDHGFEQTGEDGETTLWEWTPDTGISPASRHVETIWHR